MRGASTTTELRYQPECIPNGIEATPDGETPLVGRFTNLRIYTIDTDTGASALIEGIKASNAAGSYSTAACCGAQTFDNQISPFKLTRDLSDDGRAPWSVRSPQGQ